MGEKKIFFRLCPELGDGINLQIVDRQGVIEAVNNWMIEAEDGYYVGEEIVIECVKMTQEDYDSLPES